jgi:hypothetical protein
MCALNTCQVFQLCLLSPSANCRVIYDRQATLHIRAQVLSIRYFRKLQCAFASNKSNTMRSSVLTVTVATLLMVGTAFAQGKSRTGYANLLQRGSEVKKAYDYVVVGAGTAGLTVADRLTADGKRESLQSSMRELSDFP